MSSNDISIRGLIIVFATCLDWMLHSFFQNIPKELDESAKVDGCTQFEAFRFVIIPAIDAETNDVISKLTSSVPSVKLELKTKLRVP